MAKLTLADIANLNNTTAVTAINANSALIEAALEKTLSRDGSTPNTMGATLDMNSNRIINLPAASLSSEPVRKAEFDAQNELTRGLPGNNGADGLFSNVRTAKTGAYTPINSDAGKTIALGGSAYYSLTFNAASSYSSTFAVMVVNEDTIRWKKIVLTGGETFFLFPGCIATIINQNNVWFANYPKRSKTGLSLYVDPLGHDTNNDGTAPGVGNAFLTIQHAWDTLVKYVDVYATSAGISVADGTYTAGVLCVGMPEGTTSSLQVQITGNLATPANCVINVANGNCFQAGDSGGGRARIYIDGFTVKTTTSGHCFETHYGSMLVFSSNVHFDVCAGEHMYCHTGGYIRGPAGGYTVSGGASGFHIFAAEGAVVTNHGTPITFTNSPVFGGFVYCGSNAVVIMDGITFVNKGTVTGSKFYCDVGGYISTATNDLTYFPGSTAGFIGIGGGYDSLGAEAVTSSRLPASTLALTSTVGANIVSITVPAGDYDVYFQSNFRTAATTNVTGLLASISTSSGLLDSTLPQVASINYGAGSVLGANFDTTLSVGPVRIQSASPTIVYGVAKGFFSVDTLSCYGHIQAIPHR